VTAVVYRPTARNLALLAKRLRDGEVVALPTETVYGLAANALHEGACREIFRAKGRPTTDPLIVHVGSLEDAEQIAVFNRTARRLARAFWPGGLTLVMPKRLPHSTVPDIVTAGLPSVAVRMPAHPLMRRVLKLAGVPLAAPSANPFGYVSPTTAEHVQAGLGKRIRAILDGGPCDVGLESTILDLRDEKRVRVLRPGAVGREEISRVLGRDAPIAGKGTVEAKVAPGQLARHYSPRTRVVLHERITEGMVVAGRDDEAWVTLSRPKWAARRPVNCLDEKGNLKAAGRRLFAILRKLDGERWRVIHVEMARGGGLAEAINDRLHRAAALA
jgi:L-threonylcarbamoyladenylate synthase